MWINVTEAKTLAAEDSGLVQNVTVAALTLTLPATATVGTWTIRDGGVAASSGAAGAIVSPSIPTVDFAAGDTLAGLNVEGTEADGKSVSNTGGRVGDEITITNGPTNGGYISAPVIGDWLRES
jgi:hypothetical protein